MTFAAPLIRSFLVLALAALSLAATAAPASAASGNCAKDVIGDWYDNGRVDRLYPRSCYTRAIKILPTDVLDYSTAKEDILRALSFRNRGKTDPGDTGTTGTGTTPTTTTPTATGSTGTVDTRGETVDTATETVDTGTIPGETTLTQDETGGEAVGSSDTSGPSSVPIPLLVLGGLALLLLAAGSAGYLSRRAQARRDGGEPPLAP